MKSHEKFSCRGSPAAAPPTGQSGPIGHTQFFERTHRKSQNIPRSKNYHNIEVQKIEDDDFIYI
jgi:hypothetical protein